MRDGMTVSAGQGGRFPVPQMRLGRSVFRELSHEHKTMFDVGDLVPYLVLEVIPGDTFKVNLDAFIRIFSPLQAPIMDNIRVDMDYFYVPTRLTWTSFEEFLGAHDAAGAQDTTFLFPVMANGYTVAEGDIGQYMGWPIGLQTTQVSVNACPMRAYGLIFNRWYRDQNVRDPLSVTIDDSAGAFGFATGAPLKSAKAPDYFTRALPYLQKGTASEVGLTGEANVWTDAPVGTSITVQVGSAPTFRQLELNGSSEVAPKTGGTSSDTNRLYASLTGVGIDINELREAAAIQRYLERDARSGTRITEKIRAHFGVDVPDYRVQDPEYLGGGHGYINVSPVANTSATATEDQGQLAGVGTGRLRAGFAKSFVEHGYIIGILRARGDVTYQQGLERMWSRSTVYDLLWPEFAHLGEQPVYNRELFIQNNSGDDGVFGYVPRYADYRYKKSLVTGKLASDATGSLDFWHLAEDFASVPSLNWTFLEDSTPMSRVQAVSSEPDFIIHGGFDVRLARALPVAPVPSLVSPRF